MEIEFLYFSGCPSYEKALELLKEAMAQEGISEEIHIYRIDTDEEAERYRFIGSPTIRINGLDIDPNVPPDTPYRATCRIYRTEDGKFTPLPPAGLILQAIRKAKKQKG
ncbi:MAG: DF family (seleno)protein [bacterium JZ-2024 1]